MPGAIFGFIIGLLAGVFMTIGVLSGWRGDCANLGKHLSGGIVYICEPVKK